MVVVFVVAVLNPALKGEGRRRGRFSQLLQAPYRLGRMMVWLIHVGAVRVAAAAAFSNCTLNNDVPVREGGTSSRGGFRIGRDDVHGNV